MTLTDVVEDLIDRLDERLEELGLQFVLSASAEDRVTTTRITLEVDIEHTISTGWFP